MQIILASAKIMHDRLKSVPDVSLSLPRFLNEAQAFAKDMAWYSTETHAEMLGCSRTFLTGSASVRKSESFSHCSM